ncbi:MAG: rhodanese [Planctomycetes bacterium]|nr:rhodanese [Planctomycetota bacterium]
MPEAPRASSPEDCDVYELNDRRQRGEDPFVLDVREPKEFAIARLQGAVELPLSIFEAKWRSVLEGMEEEEIIILCRSGKRSAQACGFLKAVGYQKTRNLVGGILAWADAIDPEMEKY